MDIPIEDKCENLMNLVVESRKIFGKKCVEYQQKTLLIENKILNLQLETISNYKFKTNTKKNHVHNIDVDNMIKQVDNFTADISERQKRIDNLKNNMKNIRQIVLQLKEDKTAKKLRLPSTAEAMLADAKNKTTL